MFDYEFSLFFLIYHIGLEFKIVFVSVVHTRNIVEELKNHHSTNLKCSKILGKSVFSDENEGFPEIDYDLDFVDLGLLTSVF